jgi:hypothetical protein
VRPSCGDDETIRRVAVKRARESVERDHDLDIEWSDLDHARCDRLSYPVVERPV